VLRPQQVRQLTILGFALVVAVVLLLMAPGIVGLMQSILGIAKAPPPAPVVTDAPPPPPSPLPPGAVILDGALAGLKDLTSIHDAYGEPAYLKVLRNVLLLSEEALRARAERGVTYGTFLKYAPELRGRIFHLAGEAMQDVLPVRLADPVEGREDVYRIFMFDEAIQAGFAVDLVDRPRESLALRDPIEVDGMFYKVVRYQNTRGDDRDIPLFVARGFRRIPPVPESGKTTGQQVFEVILGIGIVAILGSAYWMTRKMAAGGQPGPLRRPGIFPEGRGGTGPAPPGSS
jgi:hypothetical protein